LIYDALGCVSKYSISLEQSAEPQAIRNASTEPLRNTSRDSDMWVIEATAKQSHRFSELNNVLAKMDTYEALCISEFISDFNDKNRCLHIDELEVRCPVQVNVDHSLFALN
jgi:hypothetical protein